MSDNWIFVFGSNLAGRHGKGAALIAHKQYGAIYGQASGLMGRSYGIPTKDARLGVLPIKTIRQYVDRFIAFAVGSPQLTFNVTPIGCGLAGYEPYEIAPLFKDCVGMENVRLCDAFFDILVQPKKSSLW